MPTPVPLKILSRRHQRIRLIIVLLFALGVGMGARSIRPLITGGVHYESLAAIILLSAACLFLLLGLRRMSYRQASVVFVIEATALWLCFAAGWIIIGRRLWMDLFAVTGAFWVFTVIPGLVLLWAIQRCWPPRRSMSCPTCTYDVRGLTSSVCPECGGRFEATCAACGCRIHEMAGGECPDCRSVFGAETLLIRSDPR
jgi:hypothetical protein